MKNHCSELLILSVRIVVMRKHTHLLRSDRPELQCRGPRQRAVACSPPGHAPHATGGLVPTDLLTCALPTARYFPVLSGSLFLALRNMPSWTVLSTTLKGGTAGVSCELSRKSAQNFATTEIHLRATDGPVLPGPLREPLLLPCARCRPPGPSC